MDPQSPVAPFAEALVRLIHSASAELVARLCGPYDLVVSCCLSTQLSWALTDLLTNQHSRLESFRLALLMIHLRLLLSLRKPETGTALWVTDVSSSALWPLEDELQRQAPHVLLDRLIQAGAVYSGGNPAVIARLASAEGVNLKAHEPWLWRTRSRSYLVQALEIGGERKP